MAREEAKNNEGMPAVYAIAEVLREWLADNNQPGLDDASMHAQMMRKQKELVKQKEVRVFGSHYGGGQTKAKTSSVANHYQICFQVFFASSRCKKKARKRSRRGYHWKRRTPSRRHVVTKLSWWDNICGYIHPSVLT